MVERCDGIAEVGSSILPDSTPLCIDLDGSLVFNDVSFISLIKCLKYKHLAPKDSSYWAGIFGYIYHIFHCIFIFLTHDRAYLKQCLAQDCRLARSELHFNQAVLEFILCSKQSLYLVTGSNYLLAEQVALFAYKDYGVKFEQVIATTKHTNLVGKAKANALNKRFGVKNYDYLGNSKQDLAVWPSARRAIIVNAKSAVKRKLQATHTQITYI